MGWYSAQIKSNQSLVQILEQELYLEFVGWNISLDVLYAAARRKGYNIVFALIIPYRVHNDVLLFKPMGEELGPYEYQASKEVLDLLSPPVNEYAKLWREMCYEILHETV